MQSKRTKLFAVSMVSGLIALNVGLAGCSKVQSAEALVSEAKEYRQKGDNKAAIIQLKNALQKNADDAQARYLLGVIYNETGDPLSAEKELRKALSLGMSPATVAPSLGTALLMLGQFQKVLDETNQVAAEKADAELLTLRGNAYLALGKPAEAKDSFDRALKNKADFPDALIGLARHALTQKDVDAAMRFVERAITTNPNYPNAWLFKGDLLRAQGKVEPALATYDEVLKIKPGDSRAHISKAGLEINAKKFDAAKASIDAARKSASGDLTVIYIQALLDYSQGKYAAAWESLQQVLRAAPEHMPSLLLAGAVQHNLGSTQQAEHHLKKYLEQNPRDLFATRLLAASLLNNGDTQRAINILMSALKDAPQDVHLLSLAGESYMKIKDYRKATEYFEKASALAPQTPMIRTALGMSRLAQGENARAMADLEVATNLEPKTSQASFLLVMTHMRLNEYDKALKAVNVLQNAEPDNPLVHNLKGGVYLGKKDIASARASFQKALSLQPNYFQAVLNLMQLDVLEKKPDTAKKRLEAFLEIDKKNTDVMTALARLADSQGRKEEATGWLERASNEKPEELGPGMQLASHYLKTGEKRKALSLAQKLNTSHPNNADVLDLLAQAELANDNNTAALQNYNKIAALVPTSALAQFRIASIHLRMQNETAAVSALRAAISLKPDYVDAQVALAVLEARKGNHEQALAVARQIQKQAGKSPTGYELEGDLLMAQKKPALAVKAYEQALGTSKSGPRIIKLHDSLKQAGREKEANARVAQWLKQNPSDTSTRMHFATANLLNQQNKAAIEEFQAILQQDPKNVAALNNIALAYQQEKDPRALEYAEKAYQLDANSPSIMDTLGWILVDQGNTNRGLPLLQKAASLTPASPDVRYHLAAALNKAGDKVAARKELTQLLESGKTFARIDEAKALQKQLQ
jgi:putative PEP-CTERM system TPR-repeat lipoprotein